MKKNILLICVFILLALVIYILFNIITVYIYNSNTAGTILNKAEEVEICNRIINKKYEIILYGETKQLINIYANKYIPDIEKFENSEEYEKLLESYSIHNIDEVYKKIGNVYIVKCTVGYLDGSLKEFVTIIKMNFNRSKAVIIYDNMFERGAVID